MKLKKTSTAQNSFHFKPIVCQTFYDICWFLNQQKHLKSLAGNATQDLGREMKEW